MNRPARPAKPPKTISSRAIPFTLTSPISSTPSGPTWKVFNARAASCVRLLWRCAMPKRETTGIKFREIEQAVCATFLHSQPIGQKALTRELLLLLGATRPDKIDLEKALRRWTEVSWFLDEGAISDAEIGTDGQCQLPKFRRLGSKPNLRQMHHDACSRILPELIQERLLEEIGKLRSLKDGASGAGARAHTLPERPRDIEDDGEFHY